MMWVAAFWPLRFLGSPPARRGATWRGPRNGRQRGAAQRGDGPARAMAASPSARPAEPGRPSGWKL